MARRPSAAMFAAMKLVLAGMTPYAAAKRYDLSFTTMYKSRLYKLWLANDIITLKQEIDVERPVPRARKVVKNFQ